ncbi:transglutaminase domain-containing protein [Ulvibacter litoralis]|uniref:Transglutaminase-like superfamily protein n=1 Tax=Ulvibacter litoralis TaxID=227084 RepID=A0A1G7CL14_9FLAO|nr:transglutaminase domain-containing protein [Ulvibacter litoralis]SDE39999.1 Transglutaminase-like superfamily protein [Ulvibacter litoralis]
MRRAPTNLNVIRTILQFWVCCVLLFFTSESFSQDYERVDATILLYPESVDTPEELSKFITRDFTSEEEKVRAIYSWIIQNVAYDPNEYKQFNYNFKDYRERNTKEEKTRDKVIKRTLQQGVAVCEGYAMLFEKLCELQGISNYLVRGDIKTNFNDIGRPFKNSHMWNVAVIDGKSYLFDPTWGAGRYNGGFIKEPSYFYYKTPPDLFFKTHYPSMFEDAFIDVVISKRVFSTMPLLIAENLKMGDVESPLQGIISTDQYLSEVPFSLTNCNTQAVFYTFGDEKLPVENLETVGNRTRFSVPLALGAETLLIYFDDQPALGFIIE